MHALFNDLRHALRALRRSASLSFVIIVSLAIGIGTNTAIFSVANALMLKPLPYPNPDRLAVLWLRSPGLNIPQDWPSPGQYVEIRTDSRSFDELSISQGRDGTLLGLDQPERVEVLRTSSNLFRLLGATPLYGRLLVSDDDLPGRPAVAIDPTVPVYDVRSMRDRLSDSLARQRFSMLLLGAFAMSALLLAAVGVYGVLAYLVTQGTRDIGVHLALGAQRSRIMRMVIRHGFELTLAGIVLGLAGAGALTRVMASLLFGVGTLDLVTFTGVSALLASIALLACSIPASRAIRVDPVVALREE